MKEGRHCKFLSPERAFLSPERALARLFWPPSPSQRASACPPPSPSAGPPPCRQKIRHLQQKIERGHELQNFVAGACVFIAGKTFLASLPLRLPSCPAPSARGPRFSPRSWQTPAPNMIAPRHKAGRGSPRAARAAAGGGGGSPGAGREGGGRAAAAGHAGEQAAALDVLEKAGPGGAGGRECGPGGDKPEGLPRSC